MGYLHTVGSAAVVVAVLAVPGIARAERVPEELKDSVETEVECLEDICEAFSEARREGQKAGLSDKAQQGYTDGRGHVKEARKLLDDDDYAGAYAAARAAKKALTAGFVELMNLQGQAEFESIVDQQKEATNERLEALGKLLSGSSPPNLVGSYDAAKLKNGQGRDALQNEHTRDAFSRFEESLEWLDKVITELLGAKKWK